MVKMSHNNCQYIILTITQKYEKVIFWSIVNVHNAPFMHEFRRTDS